MSAARLIALVADRLFTGSDPGPGQAVVLVRGDRVVAVGEPPPAAAEVIEFGDATLLPGFVDVHAHLALDGTPDGQDRLAVMTDEQVAERMAAAARVALHGGVTTLRDLGAPRLLGPSVRDALATGSVPAPRVLVAGAPITVPGGHAHSLGGAVTGAAEARAKVRELHAAGVDVIKVMASGGRLTPGSNTDRPQFTDAELTALVDEAHGLGLPVTAHAYPPAAIDQAVRCGVDGIEHCFFSVDGGLAPDLELIDRIAERGIAVCPTLGLVPDWPVPPGFRTFLDVFEQVVTQLYERGVRLVAGVDSGALPGKPHDALPHAVIEFARLGMSPAQAIAAGTRVAAETCGLAGRVGVLAPGHAADVVVVLGDPLARIDDAARVCFVMAGGTVVRDDAVRAKNPRWRAARVGGGEPAVGSG
ncbi:amidohydrolase family protein [Actinokineospora enzanensis]|uniref:amidohydrolase family protein n=1 Tax=Actinokineospora enzanensis TaxID=155975 RepID=UPI00036DA155|nr:amidohydrolase family protein [Actinokineospora enzanensis]